MNLIGDRKHDTSPTRLWDTARVAAELGWDVKVLPKAEDRYSLVISDEDHWMSWTWVLNEHNERIKWTLRATKTRPGCAECEVVRFSELEAFLADPPTGHTRFVKSAPVDLAGGAS